MTLDEMAEKLPRLAELRMGMDAFDLADEEYPPGVGAEFREIQNAIRPALLGLMALLMDAGQLKIDLKITPEVVSLVGIGDHKWLYLDVVQVYPNGGMILESGEVIGHGS